MRLSVHHATVYSYAEPAQRVTQALRMWPAPAAGQRVLNWHVEVDGRRLPPPTTDGFGNFVATHTADGPVHAIRIDVHGSVDTEDRHGVLADTIEPLPPSFYLYETPLTRITDAVRALAESAPGADGDVARLHGLSGHIRERVDYVPKQTDVATTADEALARCAGVCQDHAHLLAAAARALGYPARYVSGYLCAGVEGGDAASHAWTEIHVGELGWVGFDAANRVSPDAHYVRIGCGRDYRDAAPVRGVRSGGVAETLSVNVDVQQAQSAQ